MHTERNRRAGEKRRDVVLGTRRSRQCDGQAESEYGDAALIVEPPLRPAGRGTHVAARSWRGPGPNLGPDPSKPRDEGEGWNVLETIAIILIILWLLGMVSGYTLGNFIWILLVIAVVLFLVRLVSGRRVV
jgi:hypothetical protein